MGKRGRNQGWTKPLFTPSRHSPLPPPTPHPTPNPNPYNKESTMQYTVLVIPVSTSHPPKWHDPPLHKCICLLMATMQKAPSFDTRGNSIHLKHPYAKSREGRQEEKPRDRVIALQQSHDVCKTAQMQLAPGVHACTPGVAWRQQVALNVAGGCRDAVISPPGIHPATNGVAARAEACQKP